MMVARVPRAPDADRVCFLYQPMRKLRRLGKNTSREVTMKRERGIHERAHLSTLDDRLSTDVEGEMVAGLVARLFHQ